MGQKWCQWSLPSDNVQGLTLSSGLLARPWAVAGLAIERLDFPANVGAKSLRKFAADHVFGRHSWQVRQDFTSNRNS